jgi:hypothetical protein
MKKYISLCSLVLCFSTIQSQEVSDAIRYGQDNTNGTARFRAMGGAFGALGGDLSAINVNPAGSVVFANNHIVGSLSSFNVKNNATYFGKKTADSDNSLDLNQAGGVFVFENTNGQSSWKKFSVALNYENTNNFDNTLYAGGYNPSNSGVQYFLNNANGIPKGEFDDYFYDEFNFNDQQGFLAYKTQLIIPVNPNNSNTAYLSNVIGTGNFYQENEVVSTGYNGKFTFNAAAQYGDFLFLGINLNTHFTDYIKSTSFYEDSFDANGANPNAGVQSFRFNNDLYTYGNGFSFNLGAIFKPTQALRLGIAFESPTWLTLNDELSQKLIVDLPNISYIQDPSFNNAQPNIYAPYKVQTPAKGTLSFAYVFGKKGLISFDYGLKNYSNTTFKPKNDDYFRFLNNNIARNARENTSEYRAGAEYRIKQFSLRGGYRFEQSPYKDAATLGNLTSYSGGIGYNFGGTKLDISYTATQQDYNQQFFTQGMTDAAKINAKNNNITVTLGFDL